MFAISINLFIIHLYAPLSFLPESEGRRYAAGRTANPCHCVTPRRMPLETVSIRAYDGLGSQPRLSVKGILFNVSFPQNAYASLSKLRAYSWWNLLLAVTDNRLMRVGTPPSLALFVISSFAHNDGITGRQALLLPIRCMHLFAVFTSCPKCLSARRYPWMGLSCAKPHGNLGKLASGPLWGRRCNQGLPQTTEQCDVHV